MRRAVDVLAVDLGDPTAVLALVDAAAEVPCADCGGTGRAKVQRGPLSRPCEACEGSKVGGLSARRYIGRHALEVARALARIVHHQRPALPGLDVGGVR